MPQDPETPSHPRAVGPWKALGRRLVYENPWITLFEDSVIQPDGEQSIYGVLHFKQCAVGVLPVEDDGSIWLVGQHRYPLDRYSWEMPEGGTEEGESPEEGARRELREETGLVADRLEFLAEVHLSNSVSNQYGMLYRGSGLTPGPSAPEGSEELEVRRVPWDEVLAMMERGEITDSLTLIALLQEKLRRAKA